MLHIKSAVLYWLISTIMVFFNKNLMHAWSFNFPIFLILFEMMINTATILALKATDTIKVKSLERLIYFFKGRRHFRATLVYFKYHILVSIFYMLHSITALKALNGLSVSLYIIAFTGDLGSNESPAEL